MTSLTTNCHWWEYHWVLITSVLVNSTVVTYMYMHYHTGTSIRQAPVFQHFRALRKSPWSLLSGWMNYNYTACCWFPTSSNILILPSQFWQIRFENYWLHCSKCRILVLLQYLYPSLNFDITMCTISIILAEMFCKRFFWSLYILYFVVEKISSKFTMGIIKLALLSKHSWSYLNLEDIHEA